MKLYKVIKPFLTYGVGQEIQVSQRDLDNPDTWGKWESCLELIPEPKTKVDTTKADK